MNARTPIEERVGRALSSGDLTYREGACDLDKVIALGLVGISERLADAVFRLKYANDPKSYAQGLAGVVSMAKQLNVKANWRLRRDRLYGMAESVLNYWLADNCPACTGLAFEKPAGAPYLSDKRCAQCDLERPGKRPYPWALDGRTEAPVAFDWVQAPEARKTRESEERRRRRQVERYIECHKMLLCELEAAERIIGDKMIRHLGRAVNAL